MRTMLFNLAFLIAYGIANAQQYNVNAIDPLLVQNASVVVRLEEKNIIIKDEGHALIRHKYVYSILNAGGDEYADFALTYDKLRKVTGINGVLYSAEGSKLRSLKKNDLKDYSNTSESTLADDDRVKTHSFNNAGYPYSIEYESIEEYNGLFYLPAWIPVFDENISVEKSVLTVEFPQGYILRFKSFNTIAPIISTIKSGMQYQWQVEKYNAIKYEAFMPSWHEITPAVFLAPSSFEIQKFNGSMNSWQEFGAFLYKLNAGRDRLPVHVKTVVHNLTDQLKSPQEKINVLYKYLQQNTRYISIQFGIGGWQTLDAAFVVNNGYGDCKALTNYMYSLLKEAGIKSFYTLVKSGAGSTDLLQDFSCNQFDHIILCVPLSKDSTWLECTSQTLPAGYLSSFTSNRPVLLVDETGGTLAKTPAYGPGDNTQVRIINATLDADGLLSANVNTLYRAEQQDELQGILHGYSKEKIAEYVNTKFSLPTYEAEKYSFHEITGALPAIREDVSVKAKNYASVSGKRLFVSPNILSVSQFKISNASIRKYDFDMQSAFTDFDTVSIVVPKGFVAESIPPDVSIEMPLAKYVSSVKVSGDKIFYTRYYKQVQGRIPPSGAKNISEFFEKIYKADHSKIVFIKELLP